MSGRTISLLQQQRILNQSVSSLTSSTLDHANERLMPHDKKPTYDMFIDDEEQRSSCESGNYDERLSSTRNLIQAEEECACLSDDADMNQALVGEYGLDQRDGGDPVNQFELDTHGSRLGSVVLSTSSDVGVDSSESEDSIEDSSNSSSDSDADDVYSFYFDESFESSSFESHSTDSDASSDNTCFSPTEYRHRHSTDSNHFPFGQSKHSIVNSADPHVIKMIVPAEDANAANESLSSLEQQPAGNKEFGVLGNLDNNQLIDDDDEEDDPTDQTIHQDRLDNGNLIMQDVTDKCEPFFSTTESSCESNLFNAFQFTLNDSKLSGNLSGSALLNHPNMDYDEEVAKMFRTPTKSNTSISDYNDLFDSAPFVAPTTTIATNLKPTQVNVNGTTIVNKPQPPISMTVETDSINIFADNQFTHMNFNLIQQQIQRQINTKPLPKLKESNAVDGKIQPEVPKVAQPINLVELPTTTTKESKAQITAQSSDWIKLEVVGEKEQEKLVVKGDKNDRSSRRKKESAGGAMMSRIMNKLERADVSDVLHSRRKEKDKDKSHKTAAASKLKAKGSALLKSAPKNYKGIEEDDDDAHELLDDELDLSARQSTSGSNFRTVRSKSKDESASKATSARKSESDVAYRSLCSKYSMLSAEDDEVSPEPAGKREKKAKKAKKEKKAKKDKGDKKEKAKEKKMKVKTKDADKEKEKKKDKCVVKEDEPARDDWAKKPEKKNKTPKFEESVRGFANMSFEDHAEEIK